MVQASKGSRRGTRRSLKGHFREKYKTESYLKHFKIHDKIIIKPHTSSQRGFPNSRFSGAEGEIVSKKGNAYIIKVYLGNKEMRITISPEHLELKK